MIPITIDDHIYHSKGPKEESIRRSVIGDFREWENEQQFEKALEQLIAALQVDRLDKEPPSFI